MFVIGKHYELTYGFGSSEGTSVYKVEGWEHPLLKVSGVDGETIFNTAASHFLMARPVEMTGDDFEEF